MVANNLDYAICIWDHRPALPKPLLWARLDVPPGLLQRQVRVHGWQVNPRSIFYTDQAGRNDGVSGTVIKSDLRPGRSSANLTGNGVNLPFLKPAFSASALFQQSPSVQVQLVNEIGFCWNTTFAQGDVLRHNGTQFIARN